MLDISQAYWPQQNSICDIEEQENRNDLISSFADQQFSFVNHSNYKYDNNLIDFNEEFPKLWSPPQCQVRSLYINE